MMSTNGETAKRLLRHYFSLMAQFSGMRLDPDSHAEIGDIVDHIIAAAKDEMPTPPTTKPAPLQAADPAMTLGAAADNETRELWGIWLAEGRWLETPEGLIRYGYSFSVACAGAHNSSMDGELAEARRIDLWAAALTTD